MRFPRSMLLAMTLGLAAPVMAHADPNPAGAPEQETQQGAVGGAERPGAPNMTAPPHAPTVVGQSPVLLNADDQRAIHPPPPPPINGVQLGVLPSDAPGHYDLNRQASAGK